MKKGDKMIFYIIILLYYFSSCRHLSGGTLSSSLSLHVKSGLPKADVQESFMSSMAQSQLDASVRQSRSAKFSSSRDFASSHSRFDSQTASQREGKSELASSFGRTSMSREDFSSSSSLQTPRTSSNYKSPRDTNQTRSDMGRMTTPSQQGEGEEEEDGVKLKMSLDYPSMATMGAYSSPFPRYCKPLFASWLMFELTNGIAIYGDNR